MKEKIREILRGFLDADSMGRMMRDERMKREALEAAESAILALMPRWVPVSERLPENGVPVLVAHRMMSRPYGIGVDRITKDGKAWNGLVEICPVAGGWGGVIDYWLDNLPAPPQEEE